MTHDTLAANNFLEELPVEARAKLSRLAIEKRTTIGSLIKEGLLKLADDINANAGNGPTAPKGSSVKRKAA